MFTKIVLEFPSVLETLTTSIPFKQKESIVEMDALFSLSYLSLFLKLSGGGEGHAEWLRIQIDLASFYWVLARRF